MKLKDYIDLLNKAVESNPDALDMVVYTSSDDEGNYYNKVHYAPGVQDSCALEGCDSGDDEVFVLN